MNRKSKIVATIGPASSSPKVMAKLINEGADVFRFNLKYNTKQWHRAAIRAAREEARKAKRDLSIMVDLPDKSGVVNDLEADMLAVSFVETKEDIGQVQRMQQKCQNVCPVIAKIENGKAIKNLGQIIEAADGIMVARGDLGREIPIEQLAYWQKEIIEVCRLAAKPVIVATEMLLSMTSNPSPTRAEATDVANAIFDGTDALMLSEETAIGRNPVESLRYMARIAQFCDNKVRPAEINRLPKDTTEALVEAAINMVQRQETGIKALVVFSHSGRTVRTVASYRPAVPIVAITNNRTILSLLNLSRGVIVSYKDLEEGQFEIKDPVFDDLKKQSFLKAKDLVLVIHGNNWIRQGATSDISLLYL